MNSFPLTNFNFLDYHYAVIPEGCGASLNPKSAETGFDVLLRIRGQERRVIHFRHFSGYQSRKNALNNNPFIRTLDSQCTGKLINKCLIQK